jgi:hypothetical protein
MPQSLSGNFCHFGPWGRVLGAGLWSPFFNFHFGGAETGSIADRDRFAERLGGLVSADAAAINERTFVFRRMHHRGQRCQHLLLVLGHNPTLCSCSIQE